MSMLRDKQMHSYLVFLLAVICCGFLAGAVVVDRQTAYIKEMFLQQDARIASSLLAQGVPEEAVAAAMIHENVSSDGERFLSKIGISKDTRIKRLSDVSAIQKKMMLSLLAIGILLCVTLFVGALLFLKARERLYRNAEGILRAYIDGNYSVRLPQTSEGAIYRMLAAADQLATMLQSKNDSDRKSRDFLKSTISDISHQLKTPLAALTMYQEIIKDESDNPVIIKEYAAKMGAALNRMEQLIQSMLKITRLDAGSIAFEKAYYTLSDVITNATNDLTTRAEKENKKIRIEGDLSLQLFCDIDWTAEAIGNIVKNALDHTDTGGEIRVSCERTPAMLRICIADNGHGIAPEDMHHIFKRFYRSKKTLQTQGIGLGLPLAKAIVEGQGGLISVQSDYLQGAAFTLSFLTES